MRTTQLIGRSEALIEAQRCLGCYDAPCSSEGCPAHVDIPGFIRRLREDNLQGAGEILYAACPLASTCGLACPTTVLCEGKCTLLKMGQTAVRIGSLQSYVARNYHGKTSVSKAAPPPGRVAVVGGGPGGIGCAVQLHRLGYEVHVFDRQPTLGGLVDRVIPSHRLPHEVVQVDLEHLLKSGIKFFLNQAVDEKGAAQILKEYDAVFIGTGMSGAKEFNAPGLEAKGVIAALDYLEQARRHAMGSGAKPETGKQVVVIGGGNVALDAAVVSKMLGAERVIILYRRTLDEMPGWESEYLEAAALGVEFRWLSIVKSIRSQNGKVSAVEVQGMKLTDKQADGRRGMVEDPATPLYELPCSSVILALGQETEAETIQSFGLRLSKQGSLPVSGIFQTDNPKVFAAGEVVNGGSTVVASMSEGMKAGQAIHEWLSKGKRG